MKLNYVLILIIALIVVGFNIYVFKQNGAIRTMQNYVLRLRERDSIKINDRKVELKIRRYELENSGKKLPSHLDALDVNGNKVSLSQIINSDKLILRYSELNCNTCVSKQLDILNSYIDSIGDKNVILLTNYDNNIYMKQFKKVAKIKFAIYNVGSELNELIPDIERPYFFILEQSLRINNMYIPQMDEEELTKAYLHCIAKSYFEN